MGKGFKFELAGSNCNCIFLVPIFHCLPIHVSAFFLFTSSRRVFNSTKKGILSVARGYVCVLPDVEGIT